MFVYAMRRLIAIVPVLIGISILVFMFIHLIPGDAATILLGERGTPERLAQVREQLGLNKPWVFNPDGFAKNGIVGFFDSQYFNFVAKLLQGDLGISLLKNIPVKSELVQRWPGTIELAVGAMILSTFLGVPIGILAAVRRNSIIDNLSMTVALVGVSMPIFWLGLLLIYLFAVELHWLPPGHRLGTDLSITFKPITNLLVLDGILRGQLNVTLQALQHLILPSVALATIPTAIIARMTRSAMLETLNQDYVRTARAKGLSQRTVVYKHALRNALLPVATVIGLQVGALLGGAILTETVFSWEGIGLWIYEGISTRDYPIVQAGVIFVAFVFTLVNTIVDLSYALLDPRIQYR